MSVPDDLVGDDRLVVGEVDHADAAARAAVQMQDEDGAGRAREALQR
jgi:hypothetical protein